MCLAYFSSNSKNRITVTFLLLHIRKLKDINSSDELFKVPQLLILLCINSGKQCWVLAPCEALYVGHWPNQVLESSDLRVQPTALPLNSGIYMLGIQVGGINLPVIFLRCCKSDLISQKQPVFSPAYTSILITGGNILTSKVKPAVNFRFTAFKTIKVGKTKQVERGQV